MGISNLAWAVFAGLCVAIGVSLLVDVVRQKLRERRAYNGTSVASIDGTTNSNDDYEGKIVVATGGTIGTDGITIRVSLDGGRSGLADADPVVTLGTNNHFVIPNSGGVRVEFAVGTLLAGDTIAFRCPETLRNSNYVRKG
jgi:hypothetical protein